VCTSGGFSVYCFSPFSFYFYIPSVCRLPIKEFAQLSWYSDGQWDGQPGFDSCQVKEIFLFSTAFKTIYRAHPASHKMGTGGFFPGVKAAVV
jgi:hypothetical protein